METSRLAARLREQTEAFAEAITGADPYSMVPTCPEWRVRDLVGHIGQAHRWTAEIVRTREPVAVPDPRESEPGEPHEWTAWLRAGTDELVAAVDHTGADTPVWVILGSGPARFWLRRMLSDTTVHRVDAALTTGVPYDIPHDLATEVFAEGLRLLSAPGAAKINPKLAGLCGNGETLALLPDPPAGSGWLLTRTPDGVTCGPPTGAADVTVTGPAADLLLVFTRRLAPDNVAVTGDRAQLDNWLANTAF